MMFCMLVLLWVIRMENKRKYHIIIGSKAFFDEKLPSFTEDDNVNTFLELV